VEVRGDDPWIAERKFAQMQVAFHLQLFRRAVNSKSSLGQARHPAAVAHCALQFGKVQFVQRQIDADTLCWIEDELVIAPPTIEDNGKENAALKDCLVVEIETDRLQLQKLWRDSDKHLQLRFRIGEPKFAAEKTLRRIAAHDFHIKRLQIES